MSMLINTRFLGKMLSVGFQNMYGKSNMIIRRHLLTGLGSSHLPAVTVTEVRDKLKKIVGSPEYYGTTVDSHNRDVPIETDQNCLPEKTMRDSYQEASIPIGSDTTLRDKYINYHKRVRIGRLLEDLDTMAVWIGYTHQRIDTGSEWRSSLAIVTAGVDEIKMEESSITTDDLRVRGHVTWVGRSSMEISMKIEQNRGGSWKDAIDAKFIMVATDPLGNKKPAVCKLKTETLEENELFNQGIANKNEMKEEAKVNLLEVPPAQEEVHKIFSMFKETLDQSHGTFTKRIKPENSVWMEDTKLKNIIICFPEERNLYSKIFGGFLMRQALELAFINVQNYCGGKAVLKLVDDIAFRKSVEIGSLLYMSSQVSYTSDKMIQCKVHAEVVNPGFKNPKTTNIFHFLFQTDNDIPRVVPKSFSEYLMYLDGERRFLKATKNLS